MRNDLLVTATIGPPPATALQLLLAAERLFAEHGLDGISLRQILIEAGSSNNSAIRYHFGTKDDLLRAIFAYRLGDLMQRRALLRAIFNPDELRAQLEAHVLPLIELAESPDSSYVSFIEQLQRAGAVEVLLHQSDAVKSQDEFASGMQRLLAHIPESATVDEDSDRLRTSRFTSLPSASARCGAMMRLCHLRCS